MDRLRSLIARFPTRPLLACAAALVASPPPAAAQPIGAPGDDAIVTDMQNEILALWGAGEFHAAVEAGRELAARFAHHPRGRTALFHAGNQIENTAMVRAADPEEVRRLLESALEFYETAAETPGQGDAARGQSVERIRAIEKKFDKLDEIEAGRLPVAEAAAALGSMEAPRAAAAILERERMAVGPFAPEAHELEFLLLVHRQQYIDALQASVEESFRRVRDTRPELFAASLDRTLPEIRAEAEKSILVAQEAVEDRRDSPHWLDFLVYLGEAHHAIGMVHAAAADIQSEPEGDPRIARSEMEAATARFRVTRDCNERILAALDETEGDPSALPAAAEERPRAAYRRMSLDRIQACDRLILTYGGPARAGRRGAGPPVPGLPPRPSDAELAPEDDSDPEALAPLDPLERLEGDFSERFPDGPIEGFPDGPLD